MYRSYIRSAHAVGCLSLLAVVACDDSTAPIANGKIEVTAVTTGIHLDALYEVFLNDTGSRPLEANGRLLYQGLTRGSHTLRLDDVSPNCTVIEGANREVLVERNRATQVTFAVECVRVELRVNVTTNGAIPDPDGYRIQVHGPYGWPTPLAFDIAVAHTGSASFEGLEHWSYEVVLTDVADDCVVQGESRVWIRFPWVSTLDFVVECGAPAS